MSERPVHELIKELSQVLVQLSDKVLQNFSHSLHAVKHQDAESARQIRRVDDEIDIAEVDLEERCLAFLALQQPVAKDLRTIVTIIKINDDLERIGDLAVHIIDRMPEVNPSMLDSFDFETMGMHAGEMVKKSIRAFVSKDRALADEVCALDEEIDVMHRLVFKKVTMLMKSQDANVDELIAALSISRYIERMADHATMIAREVIYLVTGEIVRHKGDFYENLLESLDE
ncbi:MAG: phosphate signaling complex protein PhoU [Chlorobiales bacterium]|jgi:phosphate transport system protein|nr:phosphate signaling complex protein PhoU [Chlorobiales bacterium]